MLSFKVELPSNQRVPMGAPKPRARVVLDDSSETLSVPLAVGRALQKDDVARKGFGSRAELVIHLQELQYSCAFEKLVALVGRRDYSLAEARKKLAQDGYWDVPAQRALDRALELRVLDDARFADTFIRSKVTLGWGEKRISRELAQRGIDTGSVSGWPDEYFTEDEYDRARESVPSRCLNGKDPYAKVVRYLLTRGYSNSVAHRVASDLTKAGLNDY